MSYSRCMIGAASPQQNIYLHSLYILSHDTFRINNDIHHHYDNICKAPSRPMIRLSPHLPIALARIIREDALLIAGARAICNSNITPICHPNPQTAPGAIYIAPCPPGANSREPETKPALRQPGARRTQPPPGPPRRPDAPRPTRPQSARPPPTCAPRMAAVARRARAAALMHPQLQSVQVSPAEPRAAGTAKRSAAAAAMDPAPLLQADASCKRLKPDPQISDLAACLPHQLPDYAAVDVASVYTGDVFVFGDLASDFVAESVAPASLHGLDFLVDSPLSSPGHVHNHNRSHSSPVSTDDDDDLRPKRECCTVPSSPIKSDDGSTPTASQTHAESHEQRQADRAARNRESSRRAREKAKNRFRSLEKENLKLREALCHLKMQNDHLRIQLDHSRAIQDACARCRYSTTLT